MLRYAQTLLWQTSTQPFYHGTSSVSLESILREGLIPQKGAGSAWILTPDQRKKDEKDRQKSVYVTTNLEGARLYADVAAAYTAGSRIILQLHIPNSMLPSLEPDSEWQGHGWRLVGTLPASWISSYIVSDIKSVLEKRLIEVVRSQFRLDWLGVHGAGHWMRVRHYGLELAAETGARPDVVELFSFLHDSQRQSEHNDRFHGHRAAKFAQELHSRGVFTLDAQGLDLLTHACTHHSDGLTTGNITVQTCWDGDRLDLPRVGIKPQARYLCTSAARDMIERADQRSLSQYSQHPSIPVGVLR